MAIARGTESGKKRLTLLGESLFEDMADGLGPLVTQSVFSLMENNGRLRALTGWRMGGPNLAFSNMAGSG